MREYFLDQKSSRGKVKVKLVLSNYATKADLKNTIGVDTSKFIKKVDLANLKSSVCKLDIDTLKNMPTYLKKLKRKVDKLEVDKLVSASADLSKLNNVVKNGVVYKDVNEMQMKYLILLTQLLILLLVLK